MHAGRDNLNNTASKQYHQNANSALFAAALPCVAYYALPEAHLTTSPPVGRCHATRILLRWVFTPLP